MPCACRPQQVERRRSRSLSAVIPRKYRGVSFDRAPVTQIAEPVVRAVRRYVDESTSAWTPATGWLEGDVAQARRRLRCSSRERRSTPGGPWRSTRCRACSPEVRATYDADSENSYVDFIDRLARVDLLHIDDLGAERSNPWVLEQLYAIVNARYEDERSILITTNLPLDELAEQVTERTVSRLKEMCDVLPLYGADARARLRSA